MNKYRILHAKHLIDHNECDITELDKRCGFTSRSVFYDAFGKIMGIPPAHYRKRREKAAETCSGFSGTMENSLGKNEIHQQQHIKNWDNIGTLRIGASITIGTHILPELIKEYQKHNPDLRLEVIVNKSSAIEQHILDNKIDIGLIENQSEHPDIILRPFMEDKLCAIVPPDSSLASKTSITLEELALHPFLMREKGSAGREILDAYFSLKDIHIHPLWESSSTQAIVQGVAMWLGVSVLPEMMIKKDILEHRVSYLSFPKPLKRNLNLILHRNKHLTKNMKSFIEYCMLYSEK